MFSEPMSRITPVKLTDVQKREQEKMIAAGADALKAMRAEVGMEKVGVARFRAMVENDPKRFEGSEHYPAYKTLEDQQWDIVAAYGSMMEGLARNAMYKAGTQMSYNGLELADLYGEAVMHLRDVLYSYRLSNYLTTYAVHAVRRHLYELVTEGFKNDHRFIQESGFRANRNGDLKGFDSLPGKEEEPKDDYNDLHHEAIGRIKDTLTKPDLEVLHGLEFGEHGWITNLSKQHGCSKENIRNRIKRLVAKIRKEYEKLANEKRQLLAA